MYKLPLEVMLQIATPKAAKLYDTTGHHSLSLDTRLRISNLLDSYSHDRGTHDRTRQLSNAKTAKTEEHLRRSPVNSRLKRNSRIRFPLSHSVRSPEYSQAAGHDTISHNHDLTDSTRTSYRYETCKT